MPYVIRGKVSKDFQEYPWKEYDPPISMYYNKTSVRGVDRTDINNAAVYPNKKGAQVAAQWFDAEDREIIEVKVKIEEV